jgi:hypothetical protein
LRTDRLDVLRDVASVEDDRTVGPQRRVQRGAVFGDVDALAADEPPDPAAHVARIGERREEPQRLVGYVVLRIIEKQRAVRDRITLEAFRIGGEEAAQIERARTEVIGKRLPGRQRAEVGHAGL